jgi:hypothetical protein
MIAIVPVLREVEHLAAQQQTDAAFAALGRAELEFERLKSFLSAQKPIALAG